MPNPKGPVILQYPHLAHVDPRELDEVNALLAARNKNRGRKPVNGRDPLWRVPRKRTRFPGQHACCWYCGCEVVWGANGMGGVVMLREWRFLAIGSSLRGRFSC